MNSIGERLEGLMNSEGISAYKLGLEIGIHQSTIGRIMKNESKPNRDSLNRICKYFGVSPEWLINGSKTPEKHLNFNEDRPTYNFRDDGISNKLIKCLEDSLFDKERIIKDKDELLSFHKSEINRLEKELNDFKSSKSLSKKID